MFNGDGSPDFDLLFVGVALIVCSIPPLMFCVFKIFGKSRIKYDGQPTKQPTFTTELEALIAIEANTRQALELLRQQNRKSFWSMLFLFGMFSGD